jgi:hypothetical protein
MNGKVLVAILVGLVVLFTVSIVVSTQSGNVFSSFNGIWNEVVKSEEVAQTEGESSLQDFHSNFIKSTEESCTTDCFCNPNVITPIPTGYEIKVFNQNDDRRTSDFTLLNADNQVIDKFPENFNLGLFVTYNGGDRRIQCVIPDSFTIEGDGKDWYASWDRFTSKGKFYTDVAGEDTNMYLYKISSDTYCILTHFVDEDFAHKAGDSFVAGFESLIETTEEITKNQGKYVEIRTSSSKVLYSQSIFEFQKQGLACEK